MKKGVLLFFQKKDRRGQGADLSNSANMSLFR
jgi:hypothetical protein